MSVDRKTLFFIFSMIVCTVSAFLFKIGLHSEMNAMVFFIPFYVIWVSSAFLQFNKKFSDWWNSRPNFMREKITSFVVKNLKSRFSNHEFKIKQFEEFDDQRQFDVIVDKNSSSILWQQPKSVNYIDEISKVDRKELKSIMINAIEKYIEGANNDIDKRNNVEA